MYARCTECRSYLAGPVTESFDMPELGQSANIGTATMVIHRKLQQMPHPIALIAIAIALSACGSDTTVDEAEQRAIERCDQIELNDCAPDRYDNCLECNRACAEECRYHASLCNEDFECDVP